MKMVYIDEEDKYVTEREAKFPHSVNKNVIRVEDLVEVEMSLPKGYVWKSYFGFSRVWRIVWGEVEFFRFPYQSVYYQIGPFWLHRKVKWGGDE